MLTFYLNLLVGGTLSNFCCFFLAIISRLHNKGVYVKMGIRKMMGRKMCKDMHKEIRLEVDGKVVDLPPVEGIIILNILSWGSGANPWGFERDDQFSTPNHWDGMLEVVGVTGVLHLGQIQSGLRSAMRIAQVSLLLENLHFLGLVALRTFLQGGSHPHTNELRAPHPSGWGAMDSERRRDRRPQIRLEGIKIHRLLFPKDFFVTC